MRRYAFGVASITVSTDLTAVERRPKIRVLFIQAVPSLRIENVNSEVPP